MSATDGEMVGQIDVWNSGTFGQRFLAELNQNRALIEDYHREDTRLEGLCRDEHLPEYLEGNRFFDQFEALKIRVADVLVDREIRAWHYTRLFDFEVSAMRNELKLSTEQSMQDRLNGLKCREVLTDQEVELLLEGSALKTQKRNRENRFFCVPVPKHVTDKGVELLLSNWGGEVVYFHQHDDVLKQKLSTLGTPRVIEIAVTVSEPLRRYALADCVLNTYALDLGLPLCPANIDLCIKDDPPPIRVLAVHSKGESEFWGIGSSYPEGAELLLSRRDRWERLPID